MNSNNTVKVCHLSTVHSAKDIRIFYKECRSLSKAGYQVFFIVTHEKVEVVDGVKIIPLPSTNSRVRRIFVHTLLALFKAVRVNADIYHFHDPELIPIGWILRIFGKKVLYDVHEHVSKDILDKPWIRPYYLRKLISVTVGYYERLSANIFSGVIAATSHIAQQFKPERTALVRNLPVISFIDNIAPSEIKSSGKRRIVYTGGLTRIRGLIQMIKAMEFLDQDVELVLAGQWEDQQIEEECHSQKGWSKCRYAGYLSQQDAYALMKACDAGLLTYLPAANHFEAMPNKAFEYMACSLPMVLSEFPYWKELFGDCAVYVNPESPESIASGINKILRDEKMNRMLRESAASRLSENLSWEAEEHVLLDFYQKTINR